MVKTISTLTAGSLSEKVNSFHCWVKHGRPFLMVIGDYALMTYVCIYIYTYVNLYILCTCACIFICIVIRALTFIFIFIFACVLQRLLVTSVGGKNLIRHQMTLRKAGSTPAQRLMEKPGAIHTHNHIYIYVSASCQVNCQCAQGLSCSKLLR